MMLNIHSDAAYLSEPEVKSRLAGHFFMGSIPRKGKSIRMNDAIYVACGVLRIVMCSAAAMCLITMT